MRINQLLIKPRKIPFYPTKQQKILQNCPQKKGVCVKLTTMTPRKPNSAIRKLARVRLSNKKVIFCYIPGIGHNLQKYSTVLVRGGRTRDLPGVHFKMVRGKLDLETVRGRISSRSKYGIKLDRSKIKI